MADIDSKMTLYDFNKVALAQELKLTSLQIETYKKIIVDFVNSKDNHYYMLLCNENKDYTLFNATNRQEWLGEVIANDVIECMKNRGDLLAIDEDNNGAIALWIRQESGNISCYYFFVYDNGVIEY